MLVAKRVLDFSGGWGDRLTGFLASPSVTHVDLIEPRIKAAPLYKAQCKASGRSDLKLTIHSTGAEEAVPFLKSKFDLILTSPPYFNLELYDQHSRNSDKQVHNRYSTNDEYLKGFLFPVVSAAMHKLSPSGVLCLNISDNARKGVDICSPFLAFLRSSKDFCLVGTFAFEQPGGVNTKNLTLKHDVFHGEPIYVVCRRKARGRIKKLIKTCVKDLGG